MFTILKLLIVLKIQIMVLMVEKPLNTLLFHVMQVNLKYRQQPLAFLTQKIKNIKR